MLSIWIGGDRMKQAITDGVRKVFEGSVEEAKATLATAGDLVKLRKEVEQLTIEKGRREEEYARKDREIEHKVGLERRRQEQELTLAKRDAILSAKEEALVADRTRFEEQLKFHEDRFTQEVKYLKDMIGTLAERLPSATIAIKRK